MEKISRRWEVKRSTWWAFLSWGMVTYQARLCDPIQILKQALCQNFYNWSVVIHGARLHEVTTKIWKCLFANGNCWLINWGYHRFVITEENGKKTSFPTIDLINKVVGLWFQFQHQSGLWFFTNVQPLLRPILNMLTACRKLRKPVHSRHEVRRDWPSPPFPLLCPLSRWSKGTKTEAPLWWLLRIIWLLDILLLWWDLPCWLVWQEWETSNATQRYGLCII